MSLLQFTGGFLDPSFPIGDSNSLLLGLFKFMLIAGGILYLIFAGIMIRQVHIMRSTLITSFSPVVQIASYVHFGLAVMVLLSYFFIL